MTPLAPPARPTRVHHLFDTLDDEQRIAATHPAAALRIIAGAGTGKTTTLTARAAWLLEQGIPAERIMVLSFTRRAARQLVERTHAAVHGDSAVHRDGRRGRDGSGGGAGRLQGGTFHSMAHQLLRRHGAKLGLAESFSIIDRSDSADVMGIVRTELLGDAAGGRRFPRKEALLDMYSRSVNTGRPLSQVVDEVAPWASDRVEQIAQMCRSYVERKRAADLVDFDDLLLYWRAAALDPHLGPVLASEVDHICIDEYQDVNQLQVEIVTALLRAGCPGLTVVGDDSQAVYGFRGASPRHLLDMDDAVPGLQTVTLERNHRSTQPILDLANAIGADAPEGFLTRLHNDERLNAARPLLHRCADEDDQAARVCHNILEHRERGTALRRQAVLVRAAHHSATLELELSRRQIPYVKYGGLRFLEAAHVKDLICVFRLADNPRDELAWFRLLQLFDGVGPATARSVTTRLLDAQGCPLELWPSVRDSLPSPSRDGADALIAALGRRSAETVPQHADRLATAVAPVVADAYDNGPERIADFDALVAAAQDATTLSEVAAEITLEPPSSTSELAGPPLVDDDWLTISTVHSAKGLEWDVVHVLSVSDGRFPADMALGSPEELEEERRVFYVAVTRAADTLHLSFPLRFHHRPNGRDDAHTFGQPSRFLHGAVRSTYDTATSPLATSAATETREGPTAGRLAAAVDAGLEALWR